MSLMTGHNDLMDLMRPGNKDKFGKVVVVYLIHKPATWARISSTTTNRKLPNLPFLPC